MKDQYNKKETKEDFCGACIAAGLSVLGAGTVGLSAKDRKKKKKVFFWVGVSVTLISIIVLIYLLFIKKCNKCI